MLVEYSVQSDYKQWIILVKEVEHLFGEMAKHEQFQEALRQAIEDKRAICIKDNVKKLLGGIIICKETNNILWFAVLDEVKGKGLGEKLLIKALSELNMAKDIFVQTFSKECEAGIPARKLYMKHKFEDYRDGEINPAGLPTVIMKKTAIVKINA